MFSKFLSNCFVSFFVYRMQNPVKKLPDKNEFSTK